MEEKGITGHEVDKKIREHLKPFKAHVNDQFAQVWDKYDALYEMSLKSNIYLEQIAENTSEMKQDYKEMKSDLKDYGPRINTLEGQNEIKKITVEGKWKVIVALVSGTSILGLIATALLTWFGGFPFQ